MELLERGDELAVLSSALRQAAAGEGAMVFVGGEAGVGKSALVERFAAGVSATTRVLWGACDALFTPRPLGPLHDVARQAGGRLLAIATSSGGREAMFAAFLDELERGRLTTVLVVEDAHWADEATLDLLKFLGRRVARASALIVVTYRDSEVGPTHPLRSLLGDLPHGVVRRIAPLPLSAEAVATLARHAGRPHAAARLHAVTGGNAFYVTEVLAAEADDDMPATVRDAVLARAARLSASAREVMELVSVVPTGIEPWLVERVLAPPPSAVAECRTIGIARRADGMLAFHHELARRAVEDALEPERHRALHAATLAVLATHREGSVSAARLVHHADHAGDVEALVRLGPIAAEEAAAVGARRDAAAILTRVVPHIGGLPAVERGALLARHAYECYLVDRIDDALRSQGEALAIWRALGDARREGDTLRWLSRLSWAAGARGDAERYAMEAVRVLEAHPSGRELGMAYSNVSQLAMLADDTERAVAWGSRAIAIGESLGDVALLAHALNNVGTGECAEERRCARDRLERSLALALEHGLPEHAARAYTNLVAGAVKVRQYAAAESHLNAGLAYCQARDLDASTWYLIAWRARMRFERGDWSGAAEDAAEVLSHRVAAITRVPALVVLGRVRLNRGDPGWRALLDEARDLAAATGELQRISPVACARAEAAWLHGDLDAAAEEAGWGYRLVVERGLPWATAELALWMRRSNRIVAAPVAVPPVVALQLAGDWRAAANEWERIGCPHERALALADSGDEDATREALDALERLGATRPAGLVRRRLRAGGARHVPRGARPSTRRNPAGLTEREAEVLSLVREGLRDAEIAERLFLSPKTVGHHVSAILAKLGVRSRVEAATVNLGF
jgi:DNA-binding CsgD family transcriptional regulator/tetratricopeptide (TPR) repeat protein